MRIRSQAAMVVVIALALVAPAAARPAPGPRQVEDTYQTPSVAIQAPTGQSAYACSTRDMNGHSNVGCLTFSTRYGERYVDIEITDASGLPVPAWVGHEGVPGVGGEICGVTEKPIRIVPGLTLDVWIYPTIVDPLCPGTGTTGTVRAVFSSHR